METRESSACGPDCLGVADKIDKAVSTVAAVEIVFVIASWLCGVQKSVCDHDYIYCCSTVCRDSGCSSSTALDISLYFMSYCRRHTVLLSYKNNVFPFYFVFTGF